MHAPHEAHLAAIMRILRYFKFSSGKGLYCSKHDHLSVEAYTDVDWARSVTDRRSTSGKMLVPLPPPLGLVFLGKCYLLLTSFCFVSMANGINLTDGLDGLAGGTAALAFIGMSIVVLPICSGHATLTPGVVPTESSLLGSNWFTISLTELGVD
ncbi:hypothetical protein CsSME_00031510 [Camellia sinensis var. sinensis]